MSLMRFCLIVIAVLATNFATAETDKSQGMKNQYCLTSFQIDTRLKSFKLFI